MQFFAVPAGILATLLFSGITAASPFPQDGRGRCTIPSLPQFNYPEHELMTYNLSNPTVDGKLVYLPVRIGIPENPPPSPLVIYSTSIPADTNLLKATLRNKALYNKFSSTPAKVVASERKGLSAVVYQGGLTRSGKSGAFKVIKGCDNRGHARQELWPATGRFCVRTGRRKPELEVMIKSVRYKEIKDDPNPCLDVTLIVKPTGM